MPDLANSDDPYIDGSGNAIEQAGVDDVSAMSMEEKRKVMPMLHNLTPTKSMSIENLPEPDYERQIVISAVIGMKLLGVADTEIAEMMNTSLDRIQSIVKSPAAQVTFEKVYQNLIHVNSESIQGRIASQAGKAVDVVISMMEDTEVRDDVRLKAAQDVLDRSGTHPDQFFGETAQNSQSDDELRIVIMDEAGENERVKVDIKKGR